MSFDHAAGLNYLNSFAALRAALFSLNSPSQPVFRTLGGAVLEIASAPHRGARILSAHDPQCGWRRGP
jgi:hypothetical protein